MAIWYYEVLFELVAVFCCVSGMFIWLIDKISCNRVFCALCDVLYSRGSV